jgi:hypothetical protein
MRGGAGPKLLLRLILPHFGLSERSMRPTDEQLHQAEQKQRLAAIQRET